MNIDETVTVDTEIALIEENTGVPAQPSSQGAPAASPVRTSTADDSGNGTGAAQQAPQRGEEKKQRISPLAHRIADEHRIDLNTIVGTGAGGRVRKEDILAYVATQPQQPTIPGNGFYFSSLLLRQR